MGESGSERIRVCVALLISKRDVPFGVASIPDGFLDLLLAVLVVSFAAWHLFSYLIHISVAF